jgi:YbgC/YbaW family acyl-CoA thioester hydrolase
MARIKLELPAHFEFSTELEIRISEINYGNHLSNDAYLSLMHEARLRFFASFGYSEFNLAGASVIMGDVAIVYKKECHYGDVLKIEVTAAEFGSRSFDLFYRFIKTKTNEIACEAKTGIICYDYKEKKTVNVPDEFRNRFG